MKKSSTVNVPLYLETYKNPNSIASKNIYNIVFNLDFINADGKYKIIQITSTTPKESKTTLVSNLSYVLAQRGKKVLLMDLDFKAPRLHNLIKVDTELGLVQYLSNNLKLEQITTKTKYGFDFITAGNNISVAANLIENEKFKLTLSSLKEKYDYILIDSSPLSLSIDPFLIARQVDGVIYAVAHNKTNKNDIRKNIEELKRNEIEIIGTVLTETPTPFKQIEW